MKQKNIKISKSKIFIGITVALTIGLVLFIFISPRFKDKRQELFLRTKLGEPIIKVTYFYVGQGDATLIRDMRDGGRVMLVDGGPSAEVEEIMSRGQLVGKNHAKITILPYLKKEGIKKIDYIVATHKDGDHIAGLPYIIRNFKVGTVYDNGTNLATDYVKDFLKSIKENKSIRYEIVQPGMEMPFGDGIVVQVIGPLRMYRGTGSDENNSSVVLRITVGEISFMMAGDIEIPAELDIMGYGKDLRTTILSAPHHGSHSSSSKPFIDKVKPEVVVISCGRYNPYGLPSFDVIRRYEDLGAKIYRTDVKGNIEIITDGKTYEVTSR